MIHNFVDTARFEAHRTTKRSQICQKGEFLLLHVSNMRRVKRVGDVVDVFYRVQKHIKARLLVVGDGPELSRMKSACSAYGLEDKVQFFGKTGAIEDILHMADLLLMPSEKESFGLAALEAMAARTPVVASRTGGLPELIEEGLSGFTCTVGDVDTMAKRTLHILSPKHLEHFKENAVKRAKAFDVRRILPKYEALYNRLLTT